MSSIIGVSVFAALVPALFVAGALRELGDMDSAESLIAGAVLSGGYFILWGLVVGSMV